MHFSLPAIAVFCAISTASPMPARPKTSIVERDVVTVDSVDYNPLYSDDKNVKNAFQMRMFDLNMNGHDGASQFTKANRLDDGRRVNPRKLVVTPQSLAKFMRDNEVAEAEKEKDVEGYTVEPAKYVIIDLRDGNVSDGRIKGSFQVGLDDTAEAKKEMAEQIKKGKQPVLSSLDILEQDYVFFHCHNSQSRTPFVANAYFDRLMHLERWVFSGMKHKQKIGIIFGGFAYTSGLAENGNAEVKAIIDYSKKVKAIST